MATEILESIYLKQEREFSFGVVHDVVTKVNQRLYSLTHISNESMWIPEQIID